MPTSGSCLKFYYHMFGTITSSLSVKLETEYGLQTLWGKNLKICFVLKPLMYKFFMILIPCHNQKKIVKGAA